MLLILLCLERRNGTSCWRLVWKQGSVLHTLEFSLWGSSSCQAFSGLLWAQLFPPHKNCSNHTNWFIGFWVSNWQKITHVTILSYLSSSCLRAFNEKLPLYVVSYWFYICSILLSFLHYIISYTNLCISLFGSPWYYFSLRSAKIILKKPKLSEFSLADC